MLNTEYNDLLISLHPLDHNQSYPVRIVLNNERFFKTTYLPADIVNKFQNPKYLVTGHQLLDTLMLHEDTKTFWAEARSRYPSRRIRLHIAPEAPELHAIPWEILAEPSHTNNNLDVYIAATSSTPMSRFVQNGNGHPEPISDRPIKILIAIAAPQGLEKHWDLTSINVEEEMNNLREVFNCRTDITYKLLEGPCTLHNLEKELRRGYHILHFIGHGTYNHRQDDVALLMADDNNQVARVPSNKFMEMINRLITDKLRLIFLSSCQTSTNGADKHQDGTQPNAKAGLAQRLVNDAGIAAAVGMQGLVDIRTAREFSNRFYEGLLEHGIVDLACNQARATALVNEALDPYVPVLYMRLPDGQLFKPDPVRSALQNICQDEQFSFFDSKNDQYLHIPVHVMHLSKFQKLTNPGDLVYEPTATVEILDELEYLWREPEQHQAMAIGLLGGYGSNKSTQLKRLVWETANSSSTKPSDKLILPIYVDMMEYPHIFINGQNQLHSLIRDSLSTYWPDLTYEGLTDLIERDDVALRFLFDNGEYLSEEIAYDAYLRISQMAQEHPQNQYLFTASFNCFLAKYLKDDIKLHTLAIMPLNRRRIRYFLLNESQNDPAKAALLRNLDQSGLYNIVSVPWFLMRMLKYTQAGDIPGSYGQVMQQALDGVLSEMPHPLRGPAKETLGIMAWRMQSSHISTLSADEVFRIMDEVQGFRQYDLEDFYAGLIKCRILMTIGQEHVRFSYHRVQSYFAAKALIDMPEREREIQTIISMLSDPNRLNWWGDTVLFTCSLLARNTIDNITNHSLYQTINEANYRAVDMQALVKHILNQLVHNENLLHSEQIFLAARSLLECKQIFLAAHPLLECRQQGLLDDINLNLIDLTEHVNDAMIWRLDSKNEPNSTHRSHIAYMLGYLVSSPDSIEHLVRAAYKDADFEGLGGPDCDYINVRIAAIIALLRLEQGEQKAVLDRLDPHVAQIFCHWQAHEIEPLVSWIRKPDPSSATAIAALALGDLNAQFASSTDQAEQGMAAKAFKGLADTFLLTSSSVHKATLWSVTYALGMANSQIVTEEIILYFLAKPVQQNPSENSWVRYKCIAYLIGLLRCQEGSAHEFLTEHCIHESGDLGLTAIAIDSLGRLSDKRHKLLLEEIALGNFEEYLPNLDINEDTADTDVMDKSKVSKDVAREYIQRKAVDALAGIGDKETVAKLRNRPKRLQIPKLSNWYPELERAFYRTSEQIHWRLQAEADQTWIK